MFDEKPNNKLIKNLDNWNKKETTLRGDGDYFGSLQVFWELIVYEIGFFGGLWVG